MDGRELLRLDTVGSSRNRSSHALTCLGTFSSPAKVWKQEPSGDSVTLVRYIGNHTKPVSSIAHHKWSNSVITAALDGTVQVLPPFIKQPCPATSMLPF